MITQHRLLVAVYVLPKPIKTVVERTPKTKWKDLAGPKGKLLKKVIVEYLETDIGVAYTLAKDMWSKLVTLQCRAKAAEILRVSKGGPLDTLRIWK